MSRIREDRLRAVASLLGRRIRALRKDLHLAQSANAYLCSDQAMQDLRDNLERAEGERDALRVQLDKVDGRQYHLVYFHPDGSAYGAKLEDVPLQVADVGHAENSIALENDDFMKKHVRLRSLLDAISQEMGDFRRDGTKARQHILAMVGGDSNHNLWQAIDWLVSERLSMRAALKEIVDEVNLYENRGSYLVSGHLIMAAARALGKEDTNG